MPRLCQLICWYNSTYLGWQPVKSGTLDLYIQEMPSVIAYASLKAVIQAPTTRNTCMYHCPSRPPCETMSLQSPQRHVFVYTSGKSSSLSTRMPQSPRTRRSQTRRTPTPSGVTRPIPVTTTLRAGLSGGLPNASCRAVLLYLCKKQEGCDSHHHCSDKVKMFAYTKRATGFTIILTKDT